MTVLGILTGLILISIIMILHELGHFITGRLLGFKIEQFSLFMGPVLFERVKNNTRYNIKAFPIGASVSFAGEAEALEGQTGEHGYAKDDPGLFQNRPRWARALVIVMGPVVNLLTAILVFLVLFSWTGTIRSDLQNPPQNSLAQSYGIENGDELLSINGQRIRTDLDYSMAMFSQQNDQDISLAIKTKKGEEKILQMQPEILETRRMVGIVAAEKSDGSYEIVSVDPGSNRGSPVLMVKDIVLTIDSIPYAEGEKIRQHIAGSGEAALEVDIIREGKRMLVETMPTELDVYKDLGLILTLDKSFPAVLENSLYYPWSVIKATGSGLKMLFQGKLTMQESVAGPIGIVSMVGDVVKQEQPFSLKLQQLLMYLGLLSVAIGMTNLLPIPPFDGNHLVVLGIEGSMRRDLPLKIKHAISYIGLAIVLVLVVLVLFADLSRLFGF